MLLRLQWPLSNEEGMTVPMRMLQSNGGDGTGSGLANLRRRTLLLVLQSPEMCAPRSPSRNLLPPPISTPSVGVEGELPPPSPPDACRARCPRRRHPLP